MKNRNIDSVSFLDENGERIRVFVSSSGKISGRVDKICPNFMNVGPNS